ncbi:MAG: hypothetical protein CL868_17440 [Cytophagaceae bacterium]|nr:hypothetical protein [Cytophagaceae bacterium]|tara:strand:+ start:3029 stop:3217 length:189 start_codon:yes stop_codon:yes gene_type:complete
MFTTGQWIFALFFVIAFVIFISMSYKRDKKLHKRYYGGSKWVLVGFLIFVLLLFVIKFWLKP